MWRRRLGGENTGGTPVPHIRHREVMRRRRKVILSVLAAAVVVAGGVWAIGLVRRLTSVPRVCGAGAETVVLVHGLGRTPRSLRKLKARLELADFRVVSWDYFSTRGRIEEHGERLSEFLSTLDDEAAVTRIHIVGHSLGGIVARYALTVKRPAKMGRVVMLAPPNRGSAAARRWAPILGGLIEPLGQLSDDPGSAVNRLEGPEGVEIGVIAAAADGKVDVEDTHLPGEADHLVVPGTHTFIMDRPEVAEQVIYFLRHGRFDRSATHPSPTLGEDGAPGRGAKEEASADMEEADP